MSVKSESETLHVEPADPWEERLFVVKADELRQAAGGATGFLPIETFGQKFDRKFWEQCSAGLMPRSTAEKATNWKQLVAYVVVENHEGKILTYRRCKRSGETRLAGQRSIGVGGHVESRDGGVRGATTTHPEAVANAAFREIHEELGLRGIALQPIGYINDDSNDVGRVHFGIVYLSPLLRGYTPVYRDGITEPTWAYLDDIDPTDLEPWSQMVLEGLLQKTS